MGAKGARGARGAKGAKGARGGAGVPGVPGVLATAGVRLDDECEDPIELAFEAVDAGN